MAKEPTVEVVSNENVADISDILKGSEVEEGKEIAPAFDPGVNWNDLTTEEQLEYFERQKVAQFDNMSFEDALKEASEAKPDVDVINKANKDSLLGVPFIIRGIRVNQGNWGPFVTLQCLVKDPLLPGSENTKIVINDGSTGIARQTVALVKAFGTEKPISVPKGLRKSVFYVDRETNRVVGKTPKPNSFQAATYYFDI